MQQLQHVKAILGKLRLYFGGQDSPLAMLSTLRLLRLSASYAQLELVQMFACRSCNRSISDRNSNLIFSWGERNLQSFKQHLTTALLLPAVGDCVAFSLQLRLRVSRMAKLMKTFPELMLIVKASTTLLLVSFP